ncbi:benzoate/H(+) symporter BenE family transporter [Paenibacillus solisilvae]|uniref:Benzoate/H(+) symporter BenE family transporter n=1 Tax=Paenibacillus solisilvae TaxID=2486751 RepID=A0ABW0VP70_9BACL
MGTKTIMTGFMSALLACTGGAIMVVQAAETAGLSKGELVSWFTSAYVIGGLLNLLLTLKYKVPFAGAHSITATAFLGTTAIGFSYPQLAGAFVMSGVLILLAGVSGIFAKVIDFIPKPLIDALLAGVLLSYVIGIIPAAVELPYAGLLAGIGYFLIPRVSKRLPPALCSLLLGLIGLSFEYRYPTLPHVEFIPPLTVIPHFTMEGLLSIAVPMSVLILSNDLAVALASLKGNQFHPPVNKILTASGFASIVAGLFGGNAATVGGLMSALCSSAEAGPKGKRYGAALISSLIVIGFGALSWRVIDMINALPSPFVTMMTGFSLMGLFLKGLKSSFSDRVLFIPVLVTFSIAALHVNMLCVSTPVWALLAGMAMLKLLKRRNVTP